MIHINQPQIIRNTYLLRHKILHYFNATFYNNSGGHSICILGSIEKHSATTD